MAASFTAVTIETEQAKETTRSFALTSPRSVCLLSIRFANAVVLLSSIVFWAVQVPGNVRAIVFCVTSYSGDHFAAVRSAQVRVVDCTRDAVRGSELGTF